MNTIKFSIILGLFYSCSPVNSKAPHDIQLQSLSTKVQHYFKEIALGSEFGHEANPKIIKWKKNIKIFILGSKPEYLLKELKKIITEFNGLVHNIRIELSERRTEANLLLVLGSSQEYLKIESGASSFVKNNWGMFTVYENKKYEIERATVFVDVIRAHSREAQKHLLREEITQSLGLMQDSPRYPDSIFYESWSQTTEYSDIDKLLIQILYHPEIRPGFREEDLEKIWKKL
ncbi:MAG: DUF2927 domain-containing protein [Microscillaceae bacterium]|nr:DUF2927 domain-containing protein [Microscillaceae bacterium]